MELNCINLYIVNTFYNYVYIGVELYKYKMLIS